MKTIDMSNSGLTHEQIVGGLVGRPFTLRGLSLELPDGAADTVESIASAVRAAEAVAADTAKTKAAAEADLAAVVQDLAAALIGKGVIAAADLTAATVAKLPAVAARAAQK